MMDERMSALIASVAGFLCIWGLVSAVWMAVSRWRDPVRRRLLASVAVSRGTGGSADALHPTTRQGGGIHRVLDAALAVALRGLLMRPEALVPGMIRLRHKVGLAAGLAVAGAGGALVSFRVLSGPPGLAQVAWGAAAAWLAMWVAVRGWRQWHSRRWADAINAGLSDVLDLWVLCLGAGMSFQSALVKVGQDEELTFPQLREQLQLVHREIIAGRPRHEALRQLARRCGNSADLNALVSYIVQSERLGSSLAHTLKVYAHTLRFKRHQDAKEQIQKLPVKLAFPLILCVLPALFVVILGPSLLRMLAVLGTN